MANQVIVNIGGCGIKSSMAIGNLQKTRYRIPTHTGKPGKWKGIFQSGQSEGKSHKNTGKFREFQTNIICYFLVIFKWTVYYLLKWINFSFLQTTTKH